MITRRFIEKVHIAFDELNYHETVAFDFDAFEKVAVKTLARCAELDDALVAVRMYCFVSKNRRKIEEMFDRKLQTFNEYAYEGGSLSDNADGCIYITNAINNKVHEVYMVSQGFEPDDTFYSFEEYKNGKYTVFDDGNYYMKYAKLSSVKMKIFDKENKCLCNIVLSENLGIFLEKNLTPYELVVYDDFVGIYNRSYIESLSGSDLIDPDKMLGCIEWDMLDKDSDFGVAKLNIFVDDEDCEMLSLFAASTFLLFANMKKAEEMSEAFSRGLSQGASFALISSMIRRR